MRIQLEKFQREKKEISITIILLINRSELQLRFDLRFSLSLVRYLNLLFQFEWNFGTGTEKELLIKSFFFLHFNN